MLITFVTGIPCLSFGVSKGCKVVLSLIHSTMLFFNFLLWDRVSLVAQVVKNLPAMQETWVQSLDWEDPLDKGKATHSSILAWKIPWTISVQFSSVQFSRSVMSNSLRPHGLQHARPPCPSPTSGAYSNSCESCWWYHPTISSSVVSFSSHLQSFPASGSFPMTRFFKSDGQSIGVSASISVLPMNTQDWSLLG